MKNINHEEQYHKIIELYDVAEQLIQSVEAAELDYMEAQLSIVEPVIENVEESADVLSMEYSVFATPQENGKKVKKNKVEAALRKIFTSIEEYKSRVGNAGSLRGLLALTVDPIIEKLHNLAEELVLVFLRVVSIVIEKILHKHEVDQLKKKRQEIADLMHNMSLNPS